MQEINYDYMPPYQNEVGDTGDYVFDMDIYIK